ncbi:hypothetical protein ABZ646_02190 [Streptomyces sp. NPDC007162]|uniref:hypothetical protein n=1 Tax=Streptomyces sp. NPDC007162 TaxID=3156917 RepID=UPI0033EEC516
MVLLLLFVLSAAVIWYAGIKLSDTTDVLAERLLAGQLDVRRRQHPWRHRAASPCRPSSWSS